MAEHKICGLTIAEIRRGWQEESRRVVRHFEGQADIVSALLDEIERLRAPPSTAGDGPETWADNRKPLPSMSNAPPSTQGNAARALLDALEEIFDYRGGADSALADDYVVERAQAAIAQAKAAGIELAPPSTAGWLPMASALKDGRTILVRGVMLVHHMQGAKFPMLPKDWRPDTPQTEWLLIDWHEPAPSQEGASEPSELKGLALIEAIRRECPTSTDVED